MSITIKDVAKKVGVTPTTVSMVMRNDPRISSETKDKVMQAVKELNYYPNYIGQSLVKGKTDTIAVVSNLFFAWFKMDLLNGIGRSIFETTYKMNQYSTRDEIGEDTLKDILYGKRADGVITISLRPGIEILSEFKKHKRPIVLIEDTVEGFPGIKVDNYRGAYIATEYLIKKGRRKIGILTGETAEGRGGMNVLERIEGYKKALKEHDIDVRKKIMLETVCYTFDEGKKAFDKFIENKRGIDAIFCAAGDISAMGLIKRAQERGVKVPDDVAIVGYDDIVVSSLVTPSLTTVRQPIFEMGRAAVKMLIGQMASDVNIVNEVVIFQPELVVRESA
ncbi:MAG: LacI family DNA-binding transcriptional regulator [Candidatus Goldbacteria bacterium]|nr:LacI family DNA-binding transcriptional regulator [Candidatus Goldiibacteriota bacterium]